VRLFYGAEILRWESLASRATPLPQDDRRLAGGVEVQVDADVGGGRGRGVLPLLDGSCGGLGEDGIAAGDLDVIHGASGGYDYV